MENGSIEYEKISIGTEQLPIEAKKVVVLGYEVKVVNNNEGKEIGNKLVLKVKHPDVPEMELSKVKYEKNKKLTESGLWISKDKDGKIPFLSALAHLLRHYRYSNISDLKNKEIDTVIDENGYVIAKAYWIKGLTALYFLINWG